MTPYLNTNLLAAAKPVFSTQPGHLYAIEVYNPSNAAAFVQIFDTASAADVTLNTTVPTLSFGMETLTHMQMSGMDIRFANGMQIAATTTATGNSAPSTGLIVNLVYSV